MRVRSDAAPIGVIQLPKGGNGYEILSRGCLRVGVVDRDGLDAGMSREDFELELLWDGSLVTFANGDVWRYYRTRVQVWDGSRRWSYRWGQDLRYARKVLGCTVIRTTVKCLRVN